MFTENDLSSFDDLYSEDRIYTSSYQMCQLCKMVGLRDLAREWAHRTLYACKKRGEVREIHYLLFLLLPYFIEDNDKDAILFVILKIVVEDFASHAVTPPQISRRRTCRR